MKALIWLLRILGLNAFVIALSFWPIWIWNNRQARAVSAGLVFSLIALVVTVTGTHGCNQGGPPIFMVCFPAALAALIVLRVDRNRWLSALLTILICTTAILVTSYLTHLYHDKKYTGNPRYSAGAFWHTPFTGLYSRAPEKRNGKQPGRLQQRRDRRP